MKYKIIALLFIVSAIQGFSQSRKLEKTNLSEKEKMGMFSFTDKAKPGGPTTFFEIPFGASPTKIRETMSLKGYSATNKIESMEFYGGVLFSGMRAESMAFDFSGSHFSRGIVLIEGTPIDFYNTYKRIVSDLEKKYGRPTEMVEKYQYPYSKEDNQLHIALKGGYAEVSSKWFFEESDIYVKILKDLSVVISYSSNEYEKTSKSDY